MREELLTGAVRPGLKLPCPTCGQWKPIDKRVDCSEKRQDFKLRRHKWDRPENIDAGYVREWCPVQWVMISPVERNT